MVLISILLAPAGVAVQANVSQLLLFAMFNATLLYRPFEAPHVARLELLSIGTSFSTLWLGTFFWALDDSFFAIVLSILIVTINVVFILRLVQTMIGDTCRDYKVVSRVGNLRKYLSRRNLSAQEPQSWGSDQGSQTHTTEARGRLSRQQ